jgi:hypothetical protein
MQPDTDWRRSIYRASRLDEFRYYLSRRAFRRLGIHAADFARMMTTFQQSPKMDAGTAVHAVIETAGFSEFPDASRNGWHVHFDLDADLPYAGRAGNPTTAHAQRHNALWSLRCDGRAYRPRHQDHIGNRH